ncbi:MAG TPA: S53 family peptidase [Streptosporangiaceae bacterium]|nr:S53 family peptidase [Streptosporangiaceae bacterium]
MNLRHILARRSRAGSAPKTLTASAALAGPIIASVLAMLGSGVAAASPAAGPGGYVRPPCATARPGEMRCFLAYRPQAQVNQAMGADRAARPVGVSPAAIRAAYKLRSPGSSRQTVAVSIALHTPGLARFLAVYRKHYGLPPCTVSSGCFRVVNQRGQTAPLPPSGVASGWDLEATLDVSMISVACPRCRILVVEANDPSAVSLAATERTAARLGAQVISNSYGTDEDGFALTVRKAYQRPGHTIVAASGDFGFTGPDFPADLATVTAVGGTTLTKAATTRRGWRERTWRDSSGAAGSACSAYIAKPSWQHDRHCLMRTIADVSAVAANIPIYNRDYGGWVTVAGTSAAAPLIAGVYGLAGNGAKIKPGHAYQHRMSFFDITTGSNSLFAPSAQACGNDYLCVAAKGYDAPTGLGTPDGTGGF